ncbi:MAG: histone deacetylase [Actinomycetota bacterium]|nr:histone deacetylase [Actinomycetota bacterium]
MTLFYRHPSSYKHDTGGHPENAGRIRAVSDAVDRASIAGLTEAEPPRASPEQLGRAHDPDHVLALAAFCASGGGMIDMDTVASEGSWEAALRASGGACDAVERMLQGEDRAAFCAFRPPGHHAERARAMGFCLTNHVAVAAEHARSLGAERVLIFDWDVHHGNGTEQIFKASSEVLYASIHQAPLYPGTGDISYTGEGEGEGFTVNLPVPAGAGDELFRALVDHVVVPIAREHSPGLIAISAGFDGHRSDPLASCLVTEDGFRAMAAAMTGVAAELGAPLLVCLEGGYDPGALASSVVATLDGLGGDDGAMPASDASLAAPHRERLRARWPV